MKEIAVSVRDIVELIYGSGNISTTKNLMERAKEGTEIHKFWQDKYLETDQKEVFCQITHEEGAFNLTISGRIDGIINREGRLILEEIKSTHLDLDLIEEDTIPSHFAQAKLYAYIYVINNNLKKLNVTLTYIHVDTQEVRQFDRSFTMK